MDDGDRRPDESADDLELPPPPDLASDPGLSPPPPGDASDDLVLPPPPPARPADGGELPPLPEDQTTRDISPPPPPLPPAEATRVIPPAAIAAQFVEPDEGDESEEQPRRTALLVGLGVALVVAALAAILFFSGAFDDDEQPRSEVAPGVGEVPTSLAPPEVSTAPPPTAPATTEPVPVTTAAPATTEPVPVTTEAPPPTTEAPATTEPSPTTEPPPPPPEPGTAPRDFNGDGFSDILWHNFVGGDSFIWYGNASVSSESGQFTSVAEGIARQYFPVSGDYDGDGFGDVFFFNPDGESPVSYGNATVAGGPGRFTTLFETPSGTFGRRSGDFNGDGFDDVLWYALAGGNSFIWYGNAEVSTAPGRFVSVEEGIPQGLDPATGDFNGDGFADILFFDRNGDSAISYGNASVADGPGRFTTVTETPRGNLDPRTGDFNGDGFDDILWYQLSQSGSSFIWYGNADVAGGPDRFASVEEGIPANYVPFTGDFDGDGSADVFLYDTQRESLVSYGNADVAGGPGRFTTLTESVTGVFSPLN